MAYSEKKQPNKRLSLNSWWGREWLSLCENLDEERIQAARAHFNAGRLTDISFEQGRVTAKCELSSKQYFRLSFSFDSFTEEEFNILKEIFNSSSLIGTELALAKLPSVLCTELLNHGIALIPSGLEEFKMTCNCANYGSHGNICEHKIAFIFAVAEQIDRDPLLLLKLRGIPESLLESEFLNDRSSFLKLKEGLLANLEDISIDSDFSETAFCDYNQSLSDLEFNFKPWLNLLSNNPTFNETFNFKQFLQALYTELSIKADSIYVVKVKSKSKTKAELPILDEDIKWFLNLEATTYGDLFKFSLEINQLLKYSLNQDLNLLSPRLAFTLLLIQTAVLVIKTGLYTPELIFSSDKAFQVRYNPHFTNSLLMQRLRVLQTLYPRDLVSGGSSSLSEGSPKAHLSFSCLNELLSFLVTKLIKYLNLKFSSFPASELKSAFLSDSEFNLDTTQRETLAKNLSNYLAKLHIQNYRFKPIIRLEETEGIDCQLHIDIIDSSAPSPQIISFRETGKDSAIKAFPETEYANIYKQLSLIQEYIPDIQQVIATDGKAAPVLNMQRITDILISAKSILNLLGINVILPKSLEKILRPKLVVSLKMNSNLTGNAVGVEQIAEFSYEIALGESRINLEEFKKLVKSSSGLVKFNYDYVILEPEEVSSLFKKATEALPKITSDLDALHYGLAKKVNGLAFSSSAFIDNLIQSITKIDETVSVPRNLIASLRPYQERGFTWLYTNYKNGFGSCLADDMGLGKTLQVISLLLKVHKLEINSAVSLPVSAPSLVICPTSLIGNWFKECAKFAPDLKVSIYHGSKRNLDCENVDLLVSSYGILRRDLELFAARDWNLLIIDEAQNIKNHDAKQTKAIKSLKAKHRIAMSGTPVENSLAELWSIFDFINPNYLRSLKDFTVNYAIPIEKYRDKEKISQLKKVSSPFLLRRLKTDTSIIQDLPEKIIKDQFVYLTKEQASLYQSVLNNSLDRIAVTEGIERKGLIFKLITALKQLCNHPSNYTKSSDANVSLSGKALKLVDILRDILLNREKALIFTQYHEMGEILFKVIKTELAQEACFYHGSISRKDKDAMVEEFQNNIMKKIMIISLKAGGTGLNLTAANHVIHYDLWWNPAVENQATDRAFRIGQSKNVMVHRLINMGTFEEKINDLLKAKQELADLSVSASEHWITELSNEELREIFRL